MVLCVVPKRLIKEIRDFHLNSTPLQCHPNSEGISITFFMHDSLNYTHRAIFNNPLTHACLLDGSADSSPHGGVSGSFSARLRSGTLGSSSADILGTVTGLVNRD